MSLNASCLLHDLILFVLIVQSLYQQEYQRMEELDMMRKRRMMDSHRGPAKYPRMGVSMSLGILPSGALCSIGFAFHHI